MKPTAKPYNRKKEVEYLIESVNKTPNGIWAKRLMDVADKDEWYNSQNMNKKRKPMR